MSSAKRGRALSPSLDVAGCGKKTRYATSCPHRAALADGSLCETWARPSFVVCSVQRAPSVAHPKVLATAVSKSSGDALTGTAYPARRISGSPMVASLQLSGRRAKVTSGLRSGPIKCGAYVGPDPA
ncbi:hypothetical protein H2204_011980 [Knufia peltigerae]|uniref:Uncharacterized protein n=1 Tax=Knufia peltigerae TaxID=1002370 RepID=A0AA39CTF9_9EURO|nr:hypothetical protein H2204_011980 [Knufia peltigerae]